MPTVMFGPVHNLGVPFLVNEYKYGAMLDLGGVETICFSDTYLQEETLKIECNPLDAYIVWQPEWLSSEQWERLLRDVEEKGNPPLVGIFCDWFAGWNGTQAVRNGKEIRPLMGAKHVYRSYDAAIVDRVGASVLRYKRYGGVVVEEPRMFSYGRLPSLASEVSEVLDIPKRFPQDDRRYDVGFIGYRHVDAVALRSWYLEQLIEICGQNGWRLLIRDEISAGAMEVMLLQSKICFNHSLGTTLNMRVYEALAAGCVLLTDSHNIENGMITNEHATGMAWTYANPKELEDKIAYLLRNNTLRQSMAVDGVEWVTQNAEPRATWTNLITKAVEAAEKVKARR